MADSISELFEEGERNVPEGYVKDGLIHCPECHTPRQTIVTNPFTGKESKVGCICRCQKERRDKEERDARVWERRERIEKARRSSFGNDDYRGMTFDRDDGETPGVGRQMVNYTRYFQRFKEEGKGLVLFGDVGTGKTFYAACIANALIDEGYRVLMTSFPELVRMIQRGAFKDDVIGRIAGYDLLVIDDLGVERSSEYMQEQVYSIVDARYRARKPMVVTTNLTSDELRNPKDVMSARIYGRILERCLPVRFDGADRRKRNTGYKEMLGILNS